jgi:phosphoribosylaminoimidazole carboxylase PurE protein
MKPASKARVAILMGSSSDSDTMKGCAEVLKQFGVGYVARVLSAHRTPRETAAFVESAKARGIEVIIAAAGGAAHLAGVAAAHTELPVIGVPVESKSLKGLDSLLSTVQMPAGVPVACVAIGPGGAKNAAHLAVRILALTDRRLAERVGRHKASMRAEVLSAKLDL